MLQQDLFARRPYLGDPTAPTVVGTCQICANAITLDQEAVMGRWHRACLTKVGEDDEGVRYRMPGGGLMRIGKPRVIHAKTARREKARKELEARAKKLNVDLPPKPAPRAHGRPAPAPVHDPVPPNRGADDGGTSSGEETTLPSPPEALPPFPTLRFPDHNPFGPDGAFPARQGTYR
jgi:hypothetical protein